jgi:hypothetical protein
VSGVRVALDWWPPAPEEPIGEERAAALVAALRPIIGPVVAAAEADLRARVGEGKEIVRGAAPASWIARQHLGAEQRALCLGTVYEVGGGNPQANAIELLRDGTVTWWRG